MQFFIILYITCFAVGTSSFQCGVPSIKINEVIVRGYDVSPGSFPWHTAIYHRSSNSSDYKCGGTLISTTFALTADHCIKNKSRQLLSPESIFIRLGVHDLNSGLQNSQQHEIMKIHRYNDPTTQRKNDIALLELKTEAVFNEFVQPACINREVNISGQYGVAVGWGYTEYDQLSTTLQATKMPIVNMTTCFEHESMFRHALDGSLFCAGYTNGTNVCNGDSGGGLYVKRDDRWYVTGIISFTALRDGFRRICRKDTYSAFTNVATFGDWIQDVTKLELLFGYSKILPGKNPDPTQKYKNYFPRRKCGNILINELIDESPADLFEFPWFALLGSKNNEEGLFRLTCLGSLINNRYILTAARCAYNIFPDHARLGDYDLSQTIDCNPNDESDCAPPVQDIEIEALIVHQNFSLRTQRNDIALVRLAREVSFDDHIEPICLPVTQTLREQKFEKYIITGLPTNSNMSNILMKATVSALSLNDCQSYLASISKRNIAIDESKLCAGNYDTCGGILGGLLGYPVQYGARGMRFVQYGVPSSGRNCGGGPSIYMNVAYYMDWIIANMDP